MTRSTLLAGLATTVLFLFFASPALAQGVSLPDDETLQIRLDYWLNQMNAEVKITSGILDGTRVDAFDTLGMDVHQQTFVPMICSYSQFGFRLEYWRNTYLGDKNLDELVIFNGKYYLAGEHVQSKLVIDNIDARFSLDLLTQKKLDLCPMAGVRYQRYEVWLDNITTSESDNEIMHAPMPYVGGGIRFNISRYFSFGGELGVMNINFSDYDYKLKDYMDFNAYAEIRITPNFAIVGGYKYAKLRVLAKKDEADFTLYEDMQGMFVGAALTF